LNELFTLSIAPSCSLSPSELNKFQLDLKKRQKDSSGSIRMDKSAKSAIGELIEKYPSPLRRLELMFDAIIRGVEDTALDGIVITSEGPAIAKGGQLSQEQIAKVQISSFSSQPASITEQRFKNLQILEKKKRIEAKTAEEKSETSLKKVKRSRKGIRG